MKYVFSVYALFFINFFIGCQGQNDVPPAAIEFHDFPIQHPNILDDADWMLPPNSDASGQDSLVGFEVKGEVSPSGAGGASSQTDCLELITIDFEPNPFGYLVQTLPYHLEKESMDDAFVSVKIATHQIPWVIWFHSENVLFAEQADVSFDDYTGSLDRYISINQTICEVHLWDTIQAHNYLYSYEQLIAEIEIECYNP